VGSLIGITVRGGVTGVDDPCVAGPIGTFLACFPAKFDGAVIRHVPVDMGVIYVSVDELFR
jgi:hypothetical protein